MQSLLETFCLLDGSVLNVAYHEARVKQSLELAFPIALMVNDILREASRLGATSGRWRASITYSSHGIERIQIVPYIAPRIETLLLTPIAENFYCKKWANRDRLNSFKSPLPPGVEPLFTLLEQPTDTTFTNIIVERHNTLYTPESTLLAGPKRQKLLAERTVQPLPMIATALYAFEWIHLINAMLNPGEVVLHTSAVRA